MTALSIIVPTRDRPAALARCLPALAAQRGVGSFEIVVVDDGSADRRSIGAVVDATGAARRVAGAGAGPAAARNAGVVAARGDIICFTDDDCEPTPDWAARLAAALEGGADVAGGATVNGLPGDPWVEASELIVRVLQESTRRRLGRAGHVFLPSNNLACWRRVVAAHPFDEGYQGAGGEDRAWCARVAAAGCRLVLEPDAVIAHYPTLGLAGFWKQHLRYGRGAFRFARQQARSEWREPPEFYLELLRTAAAAGPRCLALLLLAQLATLTGFAAEAIGKRPR